MAFWLFKCNPDEYRLDDRLRNPASTITWTVTRYRKEIARGDVAFLWVTGPHRGIRAVMRVDEPPRDMPELATELPYWAVPETVSQYRVVGTLTHRGLNLTSDQLRELPGLEGLPVFHGMQQGTNFPVGDREGEQLLKLISQDEGPLSEQSTPATSLAATSPRTAPVFEIGQLYNRRTAIHGPYGGQQQGGISTPTRFPCVFLFTNPRGTQHGYEDGWNDDGVFLYTGEGQSGDMQFVRGNLAIRDHALNGRDLHLFESQGKGEGYRYLGMFDCGGWEYRRGPDTSGHDRRIIVFQLLLEGVSEAPVAALPNQSEPEALPLDELRRRAFAAVRPAGERPTRETRRNYYERSAAVRSYVLARAVGMCEGCRRPAPFRRPDGTPYLEPHHTRRVADGGPDHPRWVGALCPNCHEEIHHGENGAELNRRLVEYIHSIEPEQAE